MSSVVTMEDRISDTICLFFKRLDEAFIKTGNACDINVSTLVT